MKKIDVSNSESSTPGLGTNMRAIKLMRIETSIARAIYPRNLNFYIS